MNLRRGHRWLITVLTVCIALLATVAIGHRPQMPISQGADQLFLREGFHYDAPTGFQVVAQVTAKVEGTTLTMELSTDAEQRLWLQISPMGELPVSDPLVLWSPNETQKEGLTNAVRIGRVAGAGPRGWLLPSRVEKGRVLLVSPTDDRLLMQLALPQDPGKGEIS
ncbi:MAG: hypothetical protein ACON4T_07750 [Synechococcus sp.]